MISRKLFAFSLVVVLALFAGTNQNVSSGRAQDSPLTPDTPLGSSITYQGVLTYSNDNPISGSCDFQFSLYDAASGGAQVGTTLEKPAVILVKGAFTVELDFGSTAFVGEARWLEVAVRCPAGSGTYTPLSPRQALTATPYASYAQTVGPHSHWGDTWNGSGTGLSISGGTHGLSGSGSHTGVLGFGDMYGVFGSSSSTYGTGVNGYVPSSSGETTGVGGRSDSTSGTGVFGWAAATSGATYGVYGQSSSPTGFGVYGYNFAGSGQNWGVYGISNSPLGRGVYGYATDTTGTSFAAGVIGRTDSPHNARAVYGYSTATNIDPNNNTSAVYARNDSTTGYAFGVYAFTESQSGAGVYGGAATSTANYGVYSNGNMAYTGSLSLVTPTKNNGWIHMYSIASTNNIIEDVGTAQLVEGISVIAIDPKYAETVNLNVSYQVFLTPRGDCGLYLAETTPTSFTVRALGGAKCSLAFDYRIVARQSGYEDVRMAPAVDPNLVSQAGKILEEPQP